MGKSSHRKKNDKYKEEKYCYSSESRKRLISDSSSGPVEDIKSHHSRSRVPQRRHHSRSPIEKKTEAQSIEYYERKRISKEERVAGQTDRKRQSSCVDKYQEESQKN